MQKFCRIDYYNIILYAIYNKIDKSITMKCPLAQVKLFPNNNKNEIKKSLNNQKVIFELYNVVSVSIEILVI